MFPGFVFIHINFKDSTFTSVNQHVKGIPLLIEGIQKGYLFQGLKNSLSVIRDKWIFLLAK